MKEIEVIYEGGVFKPLDKVDLAEHSRGKVILIPTDEEIEALVHFQKLALKKIVGIGSSNQKDIARRHNEYIYGLKGPE